MFKQDNFFLNWDRHEQQRTPKLTFLWKNRDFLDVTIACDDGQIDAHKIIISAASPFFQNILKRNLHNHQLLYLKGTKRKEVESLLEFIYSGQTHVPRENLEEFIELAKELEIQGLSEVGNQEALDYNTEEISGDSRYDLNTERDLSRKSQITSIIEKEAISEGEGSSEMDSPNLELSETADVLLKDEEKYSYDERKEPSNFEYEKKIKSLYTEKTDKCGYCCKVCPYVTKTRSHIQEHVQSHIKGFSFECKNCDKKYECKRELRRHNRQCSASKIIKRDIV